MHKDYRPKVRLEGELPRDRTGSIKLKCTPSAVQDIHKSITKFYETKQIHEKQKQDHEKKIRNTLIRRGIKTGYSLAVFPDPDPTGTPLPSENKNKPRPTKFTMSMSGGSNTPSRSITPMQSPRESLFDDLDSLSLNVSINKWHRGVQAYDIGLHPSVEEKNVSNRSHRYNGKSLSKTIKGIEKCRPKGLRSHSHSPSVAGTLLTSERSSTSISKSPSKISGVHFLEDSHRSTGRSTPADLDSERSSTPSIEKFLFQSAINRQTKLMELENVTHLSWLDECVEIYSRSCMFTIPFDVFDFEKMTPLDYLHKFCRVSRTREAAYKAQFGKANPKKKVQSIDFSNLGGYLSHLLVGTVSNEDLDSFVKLVEVKNEPVDFRTFCKLAALAERFLYSSYSKIKRLENHVDPRSFLEQLDFTALHSKTQNVRFKSANLKRILFSLD